MFSEISITCLPNVINSNYVNVYYANTMLQKHYKSFAHIECGEMNEVLYNFNETSFSTLLMMMNDDNALRDDVVNN